MHYDIIFIEQDSTFNLAPRTIYIVPEKSMEGSIDNLIKRNKVDSAVIYKPYDPDANIAMRKQYALNERANIYKMSGGERTVITSSLMRVFGKMHNEDCTVPRYAIQHYVDTPNFFGYRMEAVSGFTLGKGQVTVKTGRPSFNLESAFLFINGTQIARIGTAYNRVRSVTKTTFVQDVEIIKT